VLDRGFRLWWSTLRIALPWILPLAAISPLIGQLTGGSSKLQEWTENFQREAERNPEALPSFAGLDTVMRGLFIELMAALIVSLLISGALTGFYTDRIVMRSLSPKQYLPTAVGRLLPLFAVALLTGFAMMVGILVLCVGFLIAWTLFSVAPQACVVERAGPIQALRRSWNLTKGRFWPMLGLLALTSIMNAVASSILGLIPQFMPAGVARDVVRIITSTVGGALGASLSACLLVFAYLDLRVRFENLDLGVVAAQHLQADQADQADQRNDIEGGTGYS
jgi:hypothetical protein